MLILRDGYNNAANRKGNNKMNSKQKKILANMYDPMYLDRSAVLENRELLTSMCTQILLLSGEVKSNTEIEFDKDFSDAMYDLISNSLTDEEWLCMVAHTLYLYSYDRINKMNGFYYNKASSLEAKGLRKLDVAYNMYARKKRQAKIRECMYNLDIRVEIEDRESKLKLSTKLNPNELINIEDFELGAKVRTTIEDFIDNCNEIEEKIND